MKTKIKIEKRKYKKEIGQKVQYRYRNIKYETRWWASKNRTKRDKTDQNRI